MKRITKLATRIARSNFGRGPRPFKLTLIVTYSCDTRCRMCSIWQRPGQGVMTVEEAGRFFERNPYFSWINLSGGEIWTRRDLPELLDAVIDGSPDLYLLDFPTTGQKTERIVEGVRRVLEKRVPKLLVTVSLDGPKEIHEDIRRTSGAFDRATQTFAELRKLRSSRFDCFLGMTLSNFNQGALGATLEAAQATIPGLSVDEFHVNLAQESAHYYQNAGMGRTEHSALAELDEFMAARGHSLHPVAWLERRYQKLTPGFLASGKTPLPCKALASSVFIDPRWNVYPCSMYDAPLGDLRTLDFDLLGLWNSEGAVRTQQEIEQGKCPHCWTPCEAYQTIMGNLLRAPRAASGPEPLSAGPASTARVADETGSHTG